jgi:protein phosphatase
VLVAGSVLTYNWALGHWFVGVEAGGNDGQVAVFRGLDVSVLGFDLFELDQSTDLAVTDLTAAARSRVRGGITADDEQDAERILDALREQRLPVCDPAPRNGAEPSATASASPAPLDPAAPIDPAAPSDPALTTAPESTSPAPATSARTPTSSEPGVDCREAD